jgi:small-conductance mechanosensitive channel
MYFHKLAQKTKTEIDDVFIEIIQKIRPPFYFFVALYFASKSLEINPWANRILSAVLMAWVTYQVIISFQILINRIVKKRVAKDANSKTAIELLGKILKGIIWAVGLLFILSNLGVNVTSLIAGLGIGGIAIAFALQNILGDLFSSFAIYFDKPFRVGDFIVVGNYKGSVEKIGIKTTRLKSLQGEELVISNRELTSAKIQNFGKIKERRVALKIGVTYNTPLEKLKAIPKMIEDIIKSVESARFDRAYFVAYGDFALLFEIVYFVESSDYVVHLKAQQEILLKIKEEFEKQGIEFAYPTQTIYLKKPES